jgi:hypothetical protein
MVDISILSKNDPIPAGSLNTEVASGDKTRQDKTTDEAPISPAERFLLKKIIHKGLLEALRSI